MYLTENGKYIKVKKPYLTENGKFVKLSKAWVTQDGKYVELILSSELIAKRLVLVDNWSSHTSDDKGVSWTKHNQAVGGQAYHSAATNGKTIVIVRNGESINQYETGALAKYTTDGVTWTDITALGTAFVSSTYHSYVSYIPQLDKFFIIKASGYNKTATLYQSTDGITWTDLGGACHMGARTPIIYDEKNNLLLFVGGYDNNGTTSDYVLHYRSPSSVSSGGLWSNTGFSATRPTSSNIATNNGLSVGTKDGSTLYSVNGTTWTTGASINAHVYSAVYAKDKYIISPNEMYEYSASTYYSVDGKTWTGVGTNGVAAKPYNLIYDGTQFISWTGQRLCRSNDGLTWTKQTIGSGYGSISFLA